MGIKVSKKSTMSLKYEGSAMFRQRIIASTLSGKVLKITNIRNEDESPGLQGYEANYLHLIESISDGAIIEINETGTSLRYKPGLLVGGQISHTCSVSRSIGWYIEGILPLAPMCKMPIQAELFGVTNDSTDLSVDTLMAVTLPLLRNFGIEGASLTVRRRGAAPKGGGAVLFYCPVVRELRPVNIVEAGLIRRVRGTAFCARVSPAIGNRVVDAARGVLNHLLPDVYIHTDHNKGIQGGLSPGYSLTLVAESTTGALLSAERTAAAGSSTGVDLPEAVGQEAALLLLDEISQGGVVDSAHQGLVLQLMAVCPEDVCKVRVGVLTEHAIETLRIIRDAFGVIFKIRSDHQIIEASDRYSRSKESSQDVNDQSTLLSCLGIGYKNLSRKVT